MFKTIITSNSKFKYVVIVNNNLTEAINKCAFIYVFNDNFFFIINLPLINLRVNVFSNDIYLKDKNSYVSSLIEGSENTLPFNKLNRLFYSWDSYYFNKLIIDGKAYRITKFINKNFKLMFGRSHMVLLITRGLFLRKKKKIKKKFIFFGTSKYNVNLASVIAKSVRPNDMYTDRGIRFSKQINNRKLGKKGSSSVI